MLKKSAEKRNAFHDYHSLWSSSCCFSAEECLVRSRRWRLPDRGMKGFSGAASKNFIMSKNFHWRICFALRFLSEHSSAELQPRVKSTKSTTDLRHNCIPGRSQIALKKRNARWTLNHKSFLKMQTSSQNQNLRSEPQKQIEAIWDQSHGLLCIKIWNF